MGQIASEALIERLADWGVDTLFGLSGDFFPVHHEGVAASGPGGIHPLNGLCDAAFLRGQPRKATIATSLFQDKIEQL